MFRFSQAGRKVTTSIVLASCLVIVAAITVAAQGPFAPSSGPFDLILKKLDALADAVNALPSSSPHNAPVTLHTGAVQVALSDVVSCVVANVSSAALTSVTYRIVAGDGAVVASGSIASLNAAETAGGGTAGGNEGMLRCDVSFNGLPTDVRANMQVHPLAGVGTKLVIVEAR